jgi:hypothetical protein
MKVLTILGNGFDLGHQLPTQFNQFIASNPSYREKYGVFSNGDNSWNYVESKYEQLLLDLMENRSQKDLSEEVEQVISDYGLNDYGEVNFYNYTFEALDEEFDSISSLVALLEEFERDFLAYLSTCCSDEQLKKLPSKASITKILSDSSRIITFNYTHTAEIVYGASNVVHIHGDVDETIAIGSGALDAAKNSTIDFAYPTRDSFSKDKHGLVEMMRYYTEDMDGHLVEDHFVRRFFDEVAAAAEERESELFALLDAKSKDSLAERQDVIDMLHHEHYDVVWIIGHSLGEADISVFDSINKDVHIIYVYHEEAECTERMCTLKRLGLSFEMVSDRVLYA